MQRTIGWCFFRHDLKREHGRSHVISIGLGDSVNVVLAELNTVQLNRDFVEIDQFICKGYK